MGPLQNVIGMLPGMPKEMRNAEIDDREITRIEAIIRSMTPAERRKPDLINGSRRGAHRQGQRASTTSDVNNLLKQFKQVQQMMAVGMGGAQGQEGQGQGPECRARRLGDASRPPGPLSLRS